MASRSVTLIIRRENPEEDGFAIFSDGPIKGIRWEGRNPDRDLAIETAKRCRDSWGDRWYVVDVKTQKLVADFPAL